jgi:hypothetical protein
MRGEWALVKERKEGQRLAELTHLWETIINPFVRALPHDSSPSHYTAPLSTVTWRN